MYWMKTDMLILIHLIMGYEKSVSSMLCLEPCREKIEPIEKNELVKTMPT